MKSDMCQYIFINKALGMSAGKMAAQAAHAAVMGYRLSLEENIEEWMLGKHYKKVVLEARDEDHLKNIYVYLVERGVRCELIIDEGLTEIEPHQATAIGCEVLDKADPNIKAIFSTFHKYQDTIKVTMEIPR